LAARKRRAKPDRPYDMEGDLIRGEHYAVHHPS